MPCEATFTTLRNRVGEELYHQVFHVLVEIAELLGFLSYTILATDGTLFPTNARYKGCTYFCSECEFIEFKGIIENIRRRILCGRKKSVFYTPKKALPPPDTRI